MRRRMFFALTLVVMNLVAVCASSAQESKKEMVRRATVKIECVRPATFKASRIIVGINKSAKITLKEQVACKGVKAQIRKFILEQILGKEVTVNTFPSRFIIPLGDILLPDGQSLSDLVAAKFSGP